MISEVREGDALLASQWNQVARVCNGADNSSSFVNTQSGSVQTSQLESRASQSGVQLPIFQVRSACMPEFDGDSETYNVEQKHMSYQMWVGNYSQFLQNCADGAIFSKVVLLPKLESARCDVKVEWTERAHSKGWLDTQLEDVVIAILEQTKLVLTDITDKDELSEAWEEYFGEEFEKAKITGQVTVAKRDDDTKRTTQLHVGRIECFAGGGAVNPDTEISASHLSSIQWNGLSADRWLQLYRWHGTGEISGKTWDEDESDISCKAELSSDKLESYYFGQFDGEAPEDQDYGKATVKYEGFDPDTQETEFKAPMLMRCNPRHEHGDDTLSGYELRYSDTAVVFPAFLKNDSNMYDETDWHYSERQRRSLETVKDLEDPRRSYNQLYHFDKASSKSDEIWLTPNETSWFSFPCVVREEDGDGNKSIGYWTLGVHCPDIPEPEPPFDPSDIWDAIDDLYLSCDMLSGAIDDLDDKFWQLGGSQEQCYGTSIGNSNKSEVIDLDDAALVGDWKVSNSGTFTAGDINVGTLHDERGSSGNIRVEAAFDVDYGVNTPYIWGVTGLTLNSGGTITIGSTTLNEQQLIQLLALIS